MPFDPISIGVAGAGMVLDFIKSQQARKSAEANQAYQAQAVANALAEARSGRSQSLQTAGALRLDQFGNATYYDPAQGRWITSYSPTQQRLIDEGQARQGRAQARGSQASEDYQNLRGEYLYQKPKSEAQSYAEIVDLINQAQGTGERQLNTLMDRFGIRTAGNLPQLQQMDRGPSPGQQLAETMLKARGAALDESLKRQAGHTSQYLPALKQFEDTANYVAPIDPTGSSIVGLESQGRQQQLSAMSDYDKLLGTIGIGGARNVGSAFDSATKAATTGPGSSDFLSLAKMLMPAQEKAGATKASGTSVGADSDGNYSGSSGILQSDHPYSKLIGHDAAPLGGAYPAPFSGVTGGDPWLNPRESIPDYGATSIPGANYSEGYYQTPWSF